MHIQILFELHVELNGNSIPPLSDAAILIILTGGRSRRTLPEHPWHRPKSAWTIMHSEINTTSRRSGRGPDAWCVGQVKRIDALLRARFPYLLTDIYETRTNHFVIVIAPEIERVEKIAKEFDNSIRFLTVPVILANSRPETFIRRIPALTDQESTGTMVGLPVTRKDLLNLLMSKFPHVDMMDIEEIRAPGRQVRIVVGTDPDTATRAEIAEFVDALDIGVPIEIRVASAERRFEIPKGHDPMFVWATALRPLAPSYVREDERFWFDNIESIAANLFDWGGFPGMEDEAFRCYFDFTPGEADHLNIRQALLLYDEVWCSLPLRERQESFLAHQRLSTDDLLLMVDVGRLKFVTTQPEERLDIRLLESVHERNPEAILGRRTTAALLVADVARTYDRSFLRDPDIVPVIRVASEVLAEKLGMNQDGLVQIMFWPLASLRGGLARTLDIGSKGGPYLSLADAVGRLVSKDSNLHVAFEAICAGEAVHLAHALDATAFGPLADYPARHNMKAFLGHLLNFHRSFNAELAPAWVANERRRNSATSMLPSVPLFDFDPDIPIAELLSDTELVSTREQGRSLYARLAGMPANERGAEIERLNTALRDRNRRITGTAVSLDALDTLSSAVSDFAGVGGILRVLRMGIEKARRRSRKLDVAVARVSGAMNRTGMESDLSFLSRVDRVASFKKERV